MFKHRSQETETMDDLNCSGEVVNQTLKELELINKWLGGNRVTLDGLDRVINNTDSKNLRIADLGCGSGGMLKMISNWASRKNKKVDLTGIDANPNIVEYARRNCKPYPQIKFQVTDVFSSEFKPQTYDIVIATLFTHHFSNEQLVRLLKQLLDQTTTAIIINDIHRHWIAYYSIKMITNLLSKSPMVKNDGPISVLRAFKESEWLEICSEAEITNYNLCWMWAFRWQLVIYTN